MEQAPSSAIQRPRTDDRPLWDVVFGMFGYPAIFIAHRLKLFPLLAAKPSTLPEICAALDLKPRPAEVIVTAATSLGFLQRDEGRYSLTPIAEDYLLDTSSTYFGFVWDLVSDNPDLVSFAGFEQAVLTDSSQVHGGEDVFESFEQQAERARAFTRGMHGLSMGSGLAWPETIDLSEHRLLLDVGGGSGAHSIGAVSRWPDLHAVVYDIAPVCEVADEFIREHGLQGRIETRVGDMWTDPFPEADLHFYSNIYHDWSEEKGRLLMAKSFDSLAPGGQIILHEVLYDDDMTGPFHAAAYSMGMLGWSVDGKQYSGREFAEMLTDAGFEDVRVTPAFGYYSLVVATKP